MASFNDIANIKPKVDAGRFLGLLRLVALRVEKGKTSSISVGECQKWGFSAEEVVPYLIVLVEAGVLRQKLQVYDTDDNEFADYDGRDLSSADPNQVKLFFKPALSGEKFADFFV